VGTSMAVFGIYRSQSQVDEAVDTLQMDGFRTTDISALFPENIGDKGFTHEKSSKAPEGAAAGIGAGAALGEPHGPGFGALPRKLPVPALASSSARRALACFRASSCTSTVWTSRYGEAGWRTTEFAIKRSASASRGWFSNCRRRPNRSSISSRSCCCMTVPPARERAPRTWLSGP